jgi:hypothetical protein
MNPIIEKAQRETGVRMLELRQERLAALLRSGRITQADHDVRRSELEARKKARL